MRVDPMASATLRTARAELPALDRAIYLNTGGLGLTPVRTARALADIYTTVAANGFGAPDVNAGLRRRYTAAKATLAAFTGAAADEIVLTPNTTEGLHVVLDGLSWWEGDEVVVSDEENPAVLVAVANFAARRRIVVRRVSLRDPRGVATALADVITRRTRLVIFSHVTHATGFVLPVADVLAVTRENRVPLLLDGAQAIGQIPFDLGASGVDFYIGAGYKWTMGPYGVGFLYVRRDWIERLTAARVGVGAQKSFDAHTFALELHPDATRFTFGARPWPLFIAWAASIEWLAEIGMPFVAERTHRLREHALGLLADDDLVVPVSAGSAGGLLTVATPGLDARSIVERLARHGIIAEWRSLPRTAPAATGVRLSLGFFLLETEIDHALETLRDVVRETRP